MIRKLAYSIANYIYRKENSTHAQRHGYYYVLQWLLFQLFEILLTVLISLMFGCFKEMIIVMVTIIFLRVTKGGIHASSAKACLILTAVLLNGCSLLSKVIADLMDVNFIFILVSISVSYILIKIINSKYGSKIFRWFEKTIK